MILFSINDKKIWSFTRNGVIIDTSILLEFINGMIKRQRGSGVVGGEMAEYQKIVNLLELTRLNDNWDKFYLTPHIMTETCSRVNVEHNRDVDFEDIAKQIMSIVDKSEEKMVCKKDFLGCIVYRSGMKLEPGDISIYAVADQFQKDKKKVAILTKDWGFTNRYAKSPYVMVIDHTQIVDLV